ncbi:hypothetical protein GBAR_LOCUS10698, partial [Geodia barretti]
METYGRTGTEGSGGKCLKDTETVNPLSSTRREALLSHILKSRERTAAMTYIIPGRKSTGCPPLVWSCVQNSGERNGGSQNGAIKTKEDGIRNHEQQLDNVKAQLLCFVQISALQQKLNSLKEEKHSLFQRLKTVLNEEDEKRGKYEDHIHSEPRILGHEEELKMGCRRISRNFIHNSGQSRRVMLTLCRTFIIYDRFVLIEAQLHVESNIAAFFSCILSDEVRGLPI